MKLEKNKKYYFKYLKIKFSFDKGKTFVEKQLGLKVYVPKEYDGHDNTLVFIEVKDINNFFPKVDKRYIRYIDKINTKGKHAWKLLQIENSDFNIDQCPYMLVSSLNSFEHPKNRNWFLIKYCGFTNKYNKINWEKWKDYELADDYVDFLFYYRTLAENLYYEVKHRNIMPENFEEWKELINEQYNYNNYYKKSTESLNNMHDVYLRDILKLW